MSNTYKASNALLVDRVNKLEQQRTELIAILKKFVNASDEGESAFDFSCMCDEFIEEARQIIDKAEAAE